MKSFITCIFFLIISISVFSADVTKNTYIYDIKGNDTLRLDKYDCEVMSQNRPCVIFLFGGSFIGGKRDRKSYEKYFQELANEGYVVVSADYRRGLLPTAEAFARGQKVGARQIVKNLQDAIDMAIEDLFDATNYIIRQSNNWHVDTQKILVSGSSSGAITALQAEYYLHSTYSELPKKLPPHFDYAGVISFAGAIFSTKGKPAWTSQPAPILFFHGDADKNVPYDKAKIFSIGFFGSKFLTNQLDEMKSPYQFFDYNNANHQIANTPMTDKLPEIKRFIYDWVIQKAKKNEHTRITDYSLPDVPKKFGIADYIKSNFKD